MIYIASQLNESLLAFFVSSVSLFSGNIFPFESILITTFIEPNNPSTRISSTANHKGVIFEFSVLFSVPFGEAEPVLGSIL